MEEKKSKKKVNKKPTKKKKNSTTVNDESSKKNKSKARKILSKIWLLTKILIILGLIGAIAIVGIVIGMLYGVFGEDLDIKEEELTLSGNSIIVDSKGNICAELSGDENRKVITLDEMNEYLPKAYIAIEDERFYSHDGVDFKRTGGAIFTYITHAGSSSYGGSTITQQLVKNITNEDADTGKEGITRKVKEWARAYQIERMLSKQQILELYLNIIFVGGNYHGVEKGAEYYFAKSAEELTLVECAFLAGVNNAPNTYNPYASTAKYGEDESKTNKINKRTKTVLNKMLELEYITQEQYDDSCKEIDEGIKFKQKSQMGSVHSYHTDAVISQVISDIANEKGWTKDFASTYVYGGGLVIYSTQNAEIQEKLESVMGKDASKYRGTSKKTGAKTQAAMTIIDNETGYVVAVYGELGEKTTSRGLNRATQSKRQTGSSIKPIADLAPAINEKKITAATLYNDAATTFPGNYNPKNQGKFQGIISVREATGRSQNIPFVKIMAELKTDKSMEYMRNMGVSTLDDKEDAGLALAIGGLYNGISTLEMAGAYETIANDGVYTTPLLYTKIEDSDGETLYEPVQEKREVFSNKTAYIVKSLLTSVVTAGYGTASYCKISGIDVAAKTGTSNEDKDRWLCGFTNYYTAATWFGYDEPEEVKLKDLPSSTNPAGRIWSDVMKKIHTGKAASTFKKPDGIVTATICRHTGLKAIDTCSDTYSEIFIAGTVPEECDERSTAVSICVETNLLANEYCPEKTTEYSSYVIEKERLKLWNTGGSVASQAPTQRCTKHTRETYLNSHDSEPTMKFIGEATITLEVGEKYVEKGATAIDEIDGDITSKIKISGSVNTSKVGTYTIVYTVKNSRDKTATLTRIIEVKKSAQNNTTPGNEAGNPNNGENGNGNAGGNATPGGNSTPGENTPSTNPTPGENQPTGETPGGATPEATPGT